MKTSLVIISSLKEELEVENISKTLSVMLFDAIEIDSISVISGQDDLALSRRIEEALSYAEKLIILTSLNSSLTVKRTVAEKLDLELVENENARKILQEQMRLNGDAFIDENACLPETAVLIPNFTGQMQGFMIENNGFTVFALPINLNELKAVCEGYVIPYFESIKKSLPEKWKFKYFGNLQNLNSALLSCQEKFNDCFSYSVDSCGGDSLVSILFLEGTEKSIIASVKREIVENLNSGFYADKNVSLAEMLFDLLKLRGKKLSVAESFTGGRIVSSLIALSGASEVVNEGVVSYSNKSKVNRLKVREEDIIKLGAVSSKVAYQMVAGLLNHGGCDVAIATTGIAGPKSDDTEKPVGLSFIAVGTKDGIHVYRYEFIGNREEITETAKNTALFLAIKNLKNV